MVPSRRTQQNWLPAFFNDFFDDDFRHFGNMMRTSSPAINVKENDKEYKVEIAAPGMSKDDFKIRINEENELVVTPEGNSPTRTSSRPCFSRTTSRKRKSVPAWSTVCLTSRCPRTLKPLSPLRKDSSTSNSRGHSMKQQRPHFGHPGARLFYCPPHRDSPKYHNFVPGHN